MTRRLLLVRHGVTDWNREGRFQGHQDPALSDEGVAEARLLAQRLVATLGDGPLRIATSPLARARRTAELIVEALDGSGRHVKLETDARLVEVGQGEWEGRTHADLLVADAERYAAWRRSDSDRQPPGAEPLVEVMARIAACLEERTPAQDESTCLVSHGGTLRLLARLVLDLPPRRAWALDLDNASLSILSQSDDGPWRLERWNDARHLLGHMQVHVDESDGEPLAF